MERGKVKEGDADSTYTNNIYILCARYRIVRIEHEEDDDGNAYITSYASRTV